jgi:hypothetical protein
MATVKEELVKIPTSIIGSEVENLRLHTGGHVKGVGSIPTFLSTDWRKDIIMYKIEGGVLAMVGTGIANQPPIKWFIPDANCIMMAVKGK